MRRIIFSFWAAMMLTAFGCGDSTPVPTESWSASDHAHPPERQAVEGQAAPQRTPRQQETSPEEQRLAAAAALWRVTCASCHGAEGRGDGPAAVAAMPNLTDPQWQASRDDEAIAHIIRVGRAPMPAYGDQIREEGIQALVAHVRRLGNGTL